MSLIDGWNDRRLSQLADYINGFAFKPEHWGKEGLPIIRIEQLKKPDSISDYYAGKLINKFNINNGDLIFSWSASLFLRIWQHGEAALNQHLFKVIEKDGVDKLFLKFFIEYYLPELKKASHGSTMQHITRKELDNFSRLFPLCKKEQDQIATILSTIDKAIEQTQAIIAKQQRIKTGLMQDLLTSGIDENGNIRSEDTHEFKDSPLGRIPVEWNSKNIEKVASLQRGYDIRECDFMSGRYPVISSSGVIGHHNECTSKAPNVLVGRKGTIGKVHFIDINFWAHDTSLFVTNFYDNDPKFIFYLFYFLDLGQFGTKSGSPSLNRNDIHPIIVAVPPLKEQKKIVQKIDSFSSLIEISKEVNNKLAREKAGLMQDLLTGKVRVTNLKLGCDSK